MTKTEFIKRYILLIILVGMFICLAVFFLVREYIASKTLYVDSTLSNKQYEMIPRTYEVNEYTNIIISDDDMVRIYLNDYINRIGNNIENSYYLLDEDYRNKKFGSMDNYVNYIKKLSYYSYEVDRYYKKEIGKYIIYGIYDTAGNFFAFKTHGVMQYSVYLDDYTVEIW